MRPGIFYSLAVMLLAIVPLHAQQWDWVQRFPAKATSVGLDDEQNVYVAGTFTGTNYIGTNGIAGEGDRNIFIAKFDPFGMPVSVSTATGLLTKLLVASNGAVFTCGALNPLSAARDSNVFLARFDGEILAWAARLPEGVDHASSMTFGPDETLYVVSATTNQAMVHHFSKDGEILEALPIQHAPFDPIAITIGPAGEIYVAGQYRRPSDMAYLIHFTARISPSGEVIWKSENSSSYGWKYYVRDIAATPDGGVVTAIYDYNPLPQSSAIVVKQSASGAVEWRGGVGAYFKRFHSAEALAVDSAGNIFVTGFADGSYYNAEHLLILMLSPTGERRSYESIGSYLRGHRNEGTDIALGRDGAVFVVGQLEGETLFGTNRLSPGGGGFVARRSTLFPELTEHQVGNDLILAWPTAGYPFALQQSTDGGSNWFFVNVPPQQARFRNQTVLPITSSVSFRLFRTNEARIQHPPRFFPFYYAPGRPFLQHTQTVIAASSEAWISHLTVYFEDEDGDPLSVTWTNLNTGEPITNDLVMAKYPGRDDRFVRYPDYYGASVAIDDSIFSAGRFSVSVTISDGTSRVTQAYPNFEVISQEQALEEFLAAMEALNSERAGRRAIALLAAYRHAENKGRNKLAEKRWSHFKKQLERLNSITEEDRGKLSDAAETIKPVL